MSIVAVTGCSGGFARTLLPLLLENPSIDKIIGIDRLPPTINYPKFEFHQEDIRDPKIKDILAGCDTLLHLAFIVLRPFNISLQEAASINLGGTWNICQAAAEAGVRKLVISSSIAAYGALPDNPDPLYENSPLRGLYTDFYYSQHKHANEIWLDGFQREFPNIVVSRARPCIVLGMQQSGTQSLIKPDGSYFIGETINRVKTQFIHEEDLATALQAMIVHDLPGAYNLVGEGAEDMVKIVTQAGLKPVEVPDETMIEQVTFAWKNGLINTGPEWLFGESTILCSNEKMLATGLWQPKYTTLSTFKATVAATLSQH